MVAAVALAAFVVPAGPARAQVLDIATDASPVGLDPHVATSFATFIVVSNVYEGLTAIEKDLRISPALSDRWTPRTQWRAATTSHRRNWTSRIGERVSYVAPKA